MMNLRSYVNYAILYYYAIGRCWTPGRAAARSPRPRPPLLAAPPAAAGLQVARRPRTSCGVHAARTGRSSEGPQSARLPASVLRGAAQRAPAPAHPATAAYQWTPVHVRQPGQAACEPSRDLGNLAAFATGFYVNTLTMRLPRGVLQGAACRGLLLERELWSARGDRPWVYRLAGSLPLVVCSGVVARTACPRADAGGPLTIGRLPEGMRPELPMRFAALLRQRNEYDSTSSRLVAVEARPDGQLVVELGGGGLPAGSAVDLSAVRFCLGGGISLADGARLHVCDVAGTRLVCLQGDLEERRFAADGRRPLASFPAGCEPPAETAFVVPGGSTGFHLVSVGARSGARDREACGVVWWDSQWHHDAVSLNGVVYEVSPEALAHGNPMLQQSLSEAQLMAVVLLQKHLLKRFGSQRLQG